MNTKHLQSRFLFYSLFVFCIVISAFDIKAQFVEIPKLTERVVDLTQTLHSSEINNLNQKLLQLEKEKGSQLTILILPTTHPEEIEQFSIRVAEKWQIGREKIDDGVILIIAKNDRKVRIEVGYGLEGAIPDAYAKRIVETLIIPEFKAGNFYEGINSGTSAIISLINGEELPVPADTVQSLTSHIPLLYKIVFPLLFVLLLFLKHKYKYKGVLIGAGIVGLTLGLIISFAVGIVAAIFALIFFMGSFGGSSSGGRYYGSGGFGGGFSGGGFGGGFSGGGGSFGGGGASGSW